MNVSNLLKIIKEEINNFYTDWSSDNEPSLADKYYEKKLGIKPEKQYDEPVSGELLGYLDKAWETKLDKPVPVYKNPTNLKGYDDYTRAVLVRNGDVYVSQSSNGLHSNIIDLLAREGIIPQSSVVVNYGQRLPEEYITLIRTGNQNQFVQSTAYDEFPIYYEIMFDEANKKNPNIKFKQLPSDSQEVFVDNEYITEGVNVMGIRELAEIVSRTGVDYDIVLEILQDELKKRGDWGVVNMFKRMTDITIEAIRQGKYILNHRK